MPEPCASRIIDVTIYARGARVTRAVSLPAPLPDGELDLVVGELSLLAEVGSLRARVLDGERQIVSIASGIVIPRAPVTVGASVERVRELTARLERVRAELTLLETRRQRLAQTMLDPRARGRREPTKSDGVDARFTDALATAAMLAEVSAGLDARSAALEAEVTRLERDLEAARLADAHATSSERKGKDHPSRQVTVRLAASGVIGGLELSYVVPAARWWPTYAVRLSTNDAGERRAEWWMEALVAQLSGEDWTGVALGLSTADLIHDARLPELASLRLGRAQPPARRGYRPAPAGLDAMFAGFERAFPMAFGAAAAPEPVFVDDLADSDTESTRGMRLRDAPPPPEAQAASIVRGLAPIAPASPQPMLAMPMAVGSAKPAPPRGAPAGAMPPMAPMSKTMMFDNSAAAPPPPPEPPAALEPGDAWLDFDSLSLAPNHDRARRGRLALADATPLAARRNRVRQRIDALAPAGVRDPQATRGHFDHVYRATGTADLASDGVAHRVSVAVAAATPRLRFRTAPREVAEVYKEAQLDNPFAAPLLAGPVEVYVEGSLLTTTWIDHLDTGGVATIGLGVEERIRVARNARVVEESAGILGGQTLVAHTVTIDLTSSLPAPVRVEVLDRIPITDDKNLEIEVVRSRPDSAPYKQTDRGTPLRRGLGWIVELPAAGKAQVEVEYRLQFSAKNEIVGGNRRE